MTIGLRKNGLMSPKKSWQKFITQKGKELKNKGLEGFFIDNVDVHYHYKKPEIYKGLTKILRTFLNYYETDYVIWANDAAKKMLCRDCRHIQSAFHMIWFQLL